MVWVPTCWLQREFVSSLNCVAPTAVTNGLAAGYKEVKGSPLDSEKEYPFIEQSPTVTDGSWEQEQFNENKRGTSSESLTTEKLHPFEFAFWVKLLKADWQSESSKISLQGRSLSNYFNLINLSSIICSLFFYLHLLYIILMERYILLLNLLL